MRKRGRAGRERSSLVIIWFIRAEEEFYRKMRSDELLKDADERARAHVLVAPPGADPRDYVQNNGRGRGGGRGGRQRGGGRGRGGRGGGNGGERMDLD